MVFGYGALAASECECACGAVCRLLPYHQQFKLLIAHACPSQATRIESL